MSSRILRALALGALLALPATLSDAQAKVVKHPGSGFSFWIPDNWKVEKSKGLYVASTPNNTAAVAFRIPKAAKADKAIDELMANLKGTYDNVKLGKGKDGDTNGVKSYIADGTGIDKKTKEKETFAVGFYAGDNHLLIAYAVLSESAKKASYQTVSKILASVKK